MEPAGGIEHSIFHVQCGHSNVELHRRVGARKVSKKLVLVKRERVTGSRILSTDGCYSNMFRELALKKTRAGGEKEVHD